MIDVKPWDVETDLKALEAGVRAVQADGLSWGDSKLLPVAFGVKKLQIMATIEDDKVSTVWLEQQIVALEDYVQSLDIVSLNNV